MLRLALIPFLTILLALGIVGVVVLFSKRRSRSRDKEMNSAYTYRKEPHADQVAEHPNRLSDNDITRG